MDDASAPDLKAIVDSLPANVIRRLDEAAEARGVSRDELVIILLSKLSSEALIDNLLQD